MYKIEIHRKVKVKRLQPWELVAGVFYQVDAIDRPPHTCVRVGDIVVVLVDVAGQKTLYNASKNVVITPDLARTEFTENEFLVDEMTDIDCIKIVPQR